jgi:IMP dehydrogenase
MGKMLREVYTFDDVSIVPRGSEILPKDVDVQTRLTKTITLNIPLLSAAMDTVTESKMAIAIARLGGIGVIHKNFSAEEQAKEIGIVKRSESGMVADPITLRPENTLGDAFAIMSEKNISGIPITNNERKLVGILTHRDIQFEDDRSKLIEDIMTRENLRTAPVNTTLEEAKDMFRRYKVEKIPIVDKEGILKGMITAKDWKKIHEYPSAAKDKEGRLLVAGAVGADLNLERVDLLVKAGVDIVVVDSAHGHHRNVLETIRMIRKGYPDLQIIGGNVVTREATRDLIEAGADAVKVGMGSGSICTTRIVAGIGIPQFSAVQDCVEEASKHGIPVISDGGIKNSGDIVKAVGAGASSVMIGSLFAGTEESPGEEIHVQGRLYKSYQGMGSLSAMRRGSSSRYFQEGQSKLVPEGVESIVPHRGNLAGIIFNMMGGFKAGMGYTGSKNIEELRNGDIEFVKVTEAGKIESHPHDVIVTQDPPNYNR